MWKANHRVLIFISGLLWLIIGIFLLSFGIYLVMETLRGISEESRFSLVKQFSRIFGGQDNGVAILLGLALFIGYLKGRYVLSRSAKRQIKRILSFPPPVHIKYIYGLGYYLLIALMIGIGISFRFFPFAQDIRGTVDIAIGSALLSGALTYFRFALSKESRMEKI